MRILRGILYYVAVPLLCAVLVILVRLLVANVLPEILQQGELTGEWEDLIGIAVSVFIAAVIVIFIHRSISAIYKFARGKDYKKGSKNELV